MVSINFKCDFCSGSNGTIKESNQEGWFVIICNSCKNYEAIDSVITPHAFRKTPNNLKVLKK